MLEITIVCRSQDDPFIILAALKPSPRRVKNDQNARFVVTKDTFSDHWDKLPNARLKRLFTMWQVYHTIKVFVNVPDLRNSREKRVLLSVSQSGPIFEPLSSHISYPLRDQHIL